MKFTINFQIIVSFLALAGSPLLVGGCGKSLFSGSTPQTAVQTSLLNFTDNFQRADATTLGSAWSILSGSFSIAADKAVSQIIGAQAIVTGSLATDVIVNGTFALNVSTTGGAAHLLARYSTASGAYYDGYVTTTQNATTTTAEILYFSGTGATGAVLNTINLTTPVSAGSLTFAAIGNTLTLSVNGAVVLDAINASITTPGAVGMQTGIGNSFSLFQATEIAATPVTLTAAAPTFTDNFQRTNSPILGTNWNLQSPCGVSEGGDFSIFNNRALIPTIVGTVSQTTPGCSQGTSNPNLNGSRALVAGLSSADVTLSSSVTAATGTCGWLIGRMVDPNNFYLGSVCNNVPGFCTGTGETSCATIQKVVGGTQSLISQTAITMSGSTNFTFTLQGSALSVSVNGTTLNATDTSISGKGAAGLLGPMGTYVSYFLATVLSF